MRYNKISEIRGKYDFFLLANEIVQEFQEKESLN